MKYLILSLIWCSSSLVGMIVIATLGEYNPVYMVHFFIGFGIILLFGFFEAIKKDREYKRL